MTWQNGRQLATATDGTSGVSYEYDQQTGLRLTKTVGSTKYSYYYAGGKLLRMTIGSDTVMDFFYDQNGDPYAMNYNGTLCYYITNLQGDVVRIVNSAGDSYGIYKYDAWGNILYSSDTAVIQANPLRYRGYIYDTETEFYYCQSRYYDPKIGRWLNADSYASTGQGFVGYNMFAYCNNNPVSRSDAGGNMFVDEGGSSFISTIESKVLLVSGAKRSNNLPTEGESGSSQTLTNPDGTPKQKRWYGPDGKPERDRDYNHPDNMPFPHDHKWENGKRSKDHEPPSSEYQFNIEPVIGIGLVTICVAGIVVVAVDDTTGIGIANDFLFAPLGAGVGKGLTMAFG